MITSTTLLLLVTAALAAPIADNANWKKGIPLGHGPQCVPGVKIAGCPDSYKPDDGYKPDPYRPRYNDPNYQTLDLRPYKNGQSDPYFGGGPGPACVQGADIPGCPKDDHYDDISPYLGGGPQCVKGVKIDGCPDDDDYYDPDKDDENPYKGGGIGPACLPGVDIPGCPKEDEDWPQQYKNSD